jgi:RNA polymerase sigma-70 factor, ECF subfamily
MTGCRGLGGLRVKDSRFAEIIPQALMSPTESQHHNRFLRSFTAHEAAIRAYVRRMVPTRADADDVMQETSVVLWEKFDTFREDGDFRAWAFGVARFEVLAWLRDKGRDRMVLNEDVITKLADAAEDDEPRFARQREALDACMEKVGADQRELLMQAYGEESKIQEVARHSGRTVPGFYQWLHRMRKLLLDCIRRALAGETTS